MKKKINLLAGLLLLITNLFAQTSEIPAIEGTSGNVEFEIKNVA